MGTRTMMRSDGSPVIRQEKQDDTKKGGYDFSGNQIVLYCHTGDCERPIIILGYEEGKLLDCMIGEWGLSSEDIGLCSDEKEGLYIATFKAVGGGYDARNGDYDDIEIHINDDARPPTLEEIGKYCNVTLTEQEI